MTEHRARMMSALKSRLVPALRDCGFVGSFPHFRRPLPERVDYLNVQFDRRGGGFTLNLGRTAPEGFAAGPWQGLPVEEIEVGHIFHDRRRITPRDAHGGWRGGEFWVFGPRSTDDPRPPEPQEFYDAIADQALETFVRVGEPWFARPPAPAEAGDPPETGGETAAPADGRQPGDPTFVSRLRWHLRLRRPRLRVGIVVGGLEPPLWRWEHWQKIVPVMDELVRRLPRPVSILSSQSYENGPDRNLTFGRMPWSEAGNRKWTTKYLEGLPSDLSCEALAKQEASAKEGPEPVHFSRTEFWSPSRSKWVEEGKDPEMYARLDRDPFGEVQGLILALRRDQLRTPGLADAADRTLAAVAAALPGSRRVINDRGWAEFKLLMMQSNSLDWPSAEVVYEWGRKRPWSQVPSFGA